MAGLLFGTSDGVCSMVEAMRPLGGPAALSGTKQQELEVAVLRVIGARDPQLAKLEVLGWYSLRSEGGLKAADAEFHDEFFQGANDVALIATPGQEPDELTLELYSRSMDGMLSTESHRCGSVQLTSDSPVVGPVEVAMRAKAPENFYIKTYELSEGSDEEEESRGWKDAFASTTKRALERWTTPRSDEEPEPISTEPTQADPIPAHEFPPDPFAKSRMETDPVPTDRTEAEGHDTGVSNLSSLLFMKRALEDEPEANTPVEGPSVAPAAVKQRSLEAEIGAGEVKRKASIDVPAAKQDPEPAPLPRNDSTDFDILREEFRASRGNQTALEQPTRAHLFKEPDPTELAIERRSLEPEIGAAQVKPKARVDVPAAKHDPEPALLPRNDSTDFDTSREEFRAGRGNQTALEQPTRAHLFREPDPTEPAIERRSLEPEIGAAEVKPKARIDVPVAKHDPEPVRLQRSESPDFEIRKKEFQAGERKHPASEQPARAEDGGERKPRAARWMPIAALLVIAASITFGFLYLPGYMGQKTAGPTSLNLKVVDQGERLQLSWNRNNNAVRDAQGGTLEITDGRDHRKLDLAAPAVANGSVLYRPNTDDVTFRLEVRGPKGASAEETLRVLDSVPVKPLEAVGTKPKPKEASGKEPAPGKLPQAALASRATGTGSKPGVAPSPVASTERTATRATDTTPKPVPPSADKKKDETERAAVNPPQQATPAPPPASSPVGASETDAAQVNPPPVESARPAEVTPSPANADPGANATVAVGQDPLRKQEKQPAPQTPNALASYKPPQPKKQVIPNLQFLGGAVTNAHGQVQVRVQVDANGRVTQAQIVSADEINSSLKNAALLAARDWVFTPAELHGKRVASNHTILFQFHPK